MLVLSILLSLDSFVAVIQAVLFFWNACAALIPQPLEGFDLLFCGSISTFASYGFFSAVMMLTLSAITLDLVITLDKVIKRVEEREVQSIGQQMISPDGDVKF